MKSNEVRIFEKAQKVRDFGKNGKFNELLVDFLALEKLCEEYNSNQKEDENYDSEM